MKLQIVHLLFTFLLISVKYVLGDTSHTNNWAVLVSTSRFWFNYRHMANVLSLYRTVKRLGIPDSQIILMLSDDIACNSRNLFPGAIFNNADRVIDLYGQSVEVDYRGYEVTVENFIRLLTDRWDDNQPKSKRLMTDENSNIFIYMTGHGGEDFLKFQDAEEISSYDIADAFEQMWEKKRYNEIFFMIDTCQANTMYSRFYSPNVLAVGSSEIDESSYSHHSDVEIGVAVIDRFTYYTLEFMEQIEKNSTLTLQNLLDYYTFDKVHSHVGVKKDLYKRDPKDVLITDFFGNVQNIISDNDEEQETASYGEVQPGLLRNILDFAVGNSNRFNSQINDTNMQEKKIIKTTLFNREDAMSSGLSEGYNTGLIKLSGVVLLILFNLLYQRQKRKHDLDLSSTLYNTSVM
ncbi:HCL388Wp [Eremothecium sinecaudum]|uniref:HCL388Wp n=1 Tax=Eremothecium sinecaudum TaxID=45286 RepID=A0A109UYF9_9SACH|nr:HCL388Wp [Eremothecium sinecaudum]AMD19763.1 HCL388Wp [Eremothecium sinecaudum]